MASPQHWLSYDLDDRRRGGRRRWPWLLLLIPLLAGFVAAGWAWYENSEGIDLAQPVAIQAALPALLVDDTMVVYVVYDSGSMQDKLLPLHQALHEVAAKPTEARIHRRDTAAAVRREMRGQGTG